MLTIRLSRMGKKNKPMYRLIVSEKGRDLYGRSLEILGSYNPHSKELQAKAERIKYWIEKGAQMSPTVNNLLIDKGIIQGEKIKASKAGKKTEEAKPTEASQATAPAPKPKTEKTEEKTEASQ